ncbi:MAG: 30S ribosomal protein S6 [Candidatus Izemoplasmatales bacterium]
MKRYEIMYIIRPNLEEQARKDLISDINAILEKFESKDPKVDEWGMRDLAYEIDDFKKGYYVVIDVVASKEAVTELNRVIKIKEDVIRHIVIARDEV